MKKKIEEMTKQELEKKQKGLLKRNKVLSICAGTSAIIACIGLSCGLCLSILSANKNVELENEVGLTFEEFKTQSVESQINSLKSQVENGELSFEDYEKQASQIKEPNREDFKETFNDEQKAKYDEIAKKGSHATAFATLSGVVGITSLLGLAVGSLAITKELHDVGWELDERRRKEKEAEHLRHFENTCKHLDNLPDMNYGDCYETAFQRATKKEKSVKEKVEDFNKTCKNLDGLDK